MELFHVHPLWVYGVLCTSINLFITHSFRALWNVLDVKWVHLPDQLIKRGLYRVKTVSSASTTTLLYISSKKYSLQGANCGAWRTTNIYSGTLDVLGRGPITSINNLADALSIAGMSLKGHLGGLWSGWPTFWQVWRAWMRNFAGWEISGYQKFSGIRSFVFRILRVP